MGKSGADGFIMRDGEFIALDNVERMFAAAGEFLDSPRKVVGLMMKLACDCVTKGRKDTAQAYFLKALDLAETSQEKATCLLSIGQLREQQDDYTGAVDWYLKAFQMDPGSDNTWYLLHNNTGYSLSMLGRYGEAEEFCRKAIKIDPARHNAYKNLGIALAGLGKFADAAVSYLTATENYPSDRRALLLLESLVQSHPEIDKQVPNLRSRMDAYRVEPGASVN